MDHSEILNMAAEEVLLREAAERRFLYKDVEELIQFGSLYYRVDVAKTPIVFRTLHPQETQDLMLRVEGDPNWKRWHLAQATHMVNGLAIEPQYGGNQAWYLYREWYQGLDEPLVEVLYTYLVSLRYRVERAIRLTDAFCHEGYSRSLWRMLKRNLQTQANIVQRLWYSFNEMEDLHDADIRSWTHTRALAGSMSNKAAKSIQEAEQKWKQKKQEQAQRVIESVVNWVLFGDRKKPEITITFRGQTYNVPRIHSSQTVEEMQEEMQRAIRGEKDYHDMVVEAFKERHRAQLLEAQKAHQEALKADWGDMPEGAHGETRFVGYTADQMNDLNPNHARPTTQQMHNPEMERINQFFNQDVHIGWLGIKGLPEPAAEEKPSLQEQIQRRKPIIHDR